MKKGTLKKVLSIAILGAMSLGFTACGSTETSDLEKIKDKGKVVVGLSADYAPYEFHILQDGEDKVVGFDIDLANEIADDLGVELEIKEMDFEALITALPAGKIDLIISGMNPTDERKKAVDFSDLYYTSSHGILVRSKDVDKYQSFEDLSGVKVGVQLGSTQEKLAQELIPDGDIQSIANVNNLILELKSGKIDAIVMEKPVAEMAVAANSELSIGVPTYEEESGGNAVAVRKGNDDLLEIINATIKRIEEDGTMDKYIENAYELAPLAEE